MPDHVHVLLRLGEQPLSAVVQRFKALASKAVGGSIWASGFHDRRLRDESCLPRVARYIVLNPVRARLVARCGDYPWWNSAML